MDSYVSENGVERIRIVKEKKWNWLPFGEYYRKNRLTFALTGVFLLIVYGIKIFNVSISHDTEAAIAAPFNLYKSWYTMGRFGLVVLKRLLGTYEFNPYAASFLMVVAMFLNVILWGYLFAWLGGKKWQDGFSSWIFPVVFFTSMIMAEQSGFLLQSYEINVALLLLGAALLCGFRAILTRRKFYSPYYLAPVACCIFAFSVYQSFVPLFAAAAAICFLLVYTNREVEAQEVSVGFCLGTILRLIVIFAASLFLYYGINHFVLAGLHLETTSYITDQIQWGKISLEEGLNNIYLHIYKAMTGKGIFYTSLHLIAYVGMLLCMLRQLFVKKTCRILYLAAAAFVLISPFLMTILMGAEPTVRTQILLPFVAGFALQYLVVTIREERFRLCRYLYVAALCLTGVLCLQQSMDAARLYYTQYIQYQEDVRVAQKISDRIEALGLGEIPEEPVVFVGARTPLKNAVCYSDDELELIGKSFFAISYGTGHGTWVMRNFMTSLGYPYVFGDDQDFAKADQLAAAMPSWPAKGSVAEKDGIIIVKLG